MSDANHPHHESGHRHSKLHKDEHLNESLSPFSAYAVHPRNVRFETQEEEETVEIFLRQHPIVNVGWFFMGALMLFVPTFIFPIFIGFLKITDYIPAGYLIVGTAFWYLATFGFILASFLHWFFNIYIVTNERIVDIDFLYLLYKRLSQAELSEIQDITYTSGGILATFFDYGNITIQTASEMPNIEFEKVPHPERVVEKIRSLAEARQKQL